MMITLLDSYASEYAEAFGIVMIIMAISCAIVLPLFWLSNKVTGGRGILYKFIQDYGYDDVRTREALLDVVGKMLYRQEGMREGGGVSLYHEVGNKFTGTYWEDAEIKHDLVVRTDGWTIEYQLDNGITKTYKP